jgi:hypothetical protein
MGAGQSGWKLKFSPPHPDNACGSPSPSEGRDGRRTEGDDAVRAEQRSKVTLTLSDIQVERLSIPMSIQQRIVSFARVFLVAGVVALAAGPQPVRAQDGAQSREGRARTFVELMAGGQFAKAFEMFTPQMKAAMPLERLSATWNSLTAQAGPFKHQIAASIVPRGVLSVVIVTCEFERATFDVQVTVNPASLVGGLALRPAVQARSVRTTGLCESRRLSRIGSDRRHGAMGTGDGACRRPGTGRRIER